MTYILLTIFAIFLIGLMYIQNINITNKDLKRQKQNLQTKLVQEKVNSNIKEFQVKQKADKELIKQSIEKDKDVSKTNSINISVGSHSLSF